ncbi:FHA domain containing protein [Stigmatella aurantiaca DW4/3-1]|nr:FHA domain containing protein [Stigmatella aurantiaca DW4/3-1]
MGILEQTDGKRFTLGSRCLLGRHPRCDIRLEEARVSGEHASVHWLGTGWELRDLGSRNGTFLEGRQLAPGERVALEAGQTFRLGRSQESFTLVDARPPTARAWSPQSGMCREASESLLQLPDDEEPLASLFLDGEGRWVLETGEVRRHGVDQERLWLQGQEWVLELPTVMDRTLEEGQPPLERLHLRIGVSRDEEHVVVTVVHGQRCTVLPSRTYHYMLATLARVRLQEKALPEAERGWVERETLCQMLATDGNKLNVDIHRVRRQLSALGIPGAAGVVERRPGSGHVRLGVASCEVFPL